MSTPVVLYLQLVLHIAFLHSIANPALVILLNPQTRAFALQLMRWDILSPASTTREFGRKISCLNFFDFPGLNREEENVAQSPHSIRVSNKQKDGEMVHL